VVLCCSLSGNPPYYDETEEENTDLHNRFIFCKIVAGDFEFDSPYWDDISPAGTTAGHRKAIRVTTFMQRLRAPDSAGRGERGSGRLPVTPRSSMSVSHEVTIENLPEPSENQQSHKPPAMLILSPSVGLSPTATMDNLPDHSKPPSLPSPTRPNLPEPKSKTTPGETSPWKMAAVLDHRSENKVLDQTKPSLAKVLDRKEPKTAIAILDHNREEKATGCHDHSERKSTPGQSQSKKVIILDQSEDRKLHGVPGQMERKTPAALEHRKMAAVLDLRDKEPGRTEDHGDKKSVSLLDQHWGEMAGFQEQDKAKTTDRAAAASVLDQKPVIMVLDQDKWKMDTVIEQIEKQMAAVLEKIEGEMPSLLEQISDRRDSERELGYRHSVLDHSPSVSEQRERQVLQHRSPFLDRRQVLELGSGTDGSRPSFSRLTIVPAADTHSQEPITHEDGGADNDESQSEREHV
ncbi:UNVERIFIED_CONTAM: hypothetical protein FKN15_042375, partial [Acipenser sinensis]